MNVSQFIVSDLVEGLGVLQVLDEGGDPVVTGELVEDVRRVEGGRLDEQQEGHPLVVRVVRALRVLGAGPHPGVRPRVPRLRQREGVRDVAVRVEGGLADVARVAVLVSEQQTVTA